MPTYLDGVSDAAHAVVWLLGVLTVLLLATLLAATVAAVGYLIRELTRDTHAAWLRRRLQRAHARSGRTTGLG